MAKLYKYKINKNILITLLCFIVISIVSIYSAGNIIGINNLFVKQIIWFISGFLTIYLIAKTDNDDIICFWKYCFSTFTLICTPN